MLKIIKEFLPKEEALLLSKEIYDTPENWWSYAIKSDDKLVYLNNTLRDSHSLKIVEQEAEKSLHLGKFSYKFKRSTTHVKGCNCYECNFKKEYLEIHIKEQVLKTTKWKNCELYESFVSAYGRGDYLGIHTDQHRGMAFILNLTTGWKPEYGGMLNILQEDGTFKSVFPEFNSLILFKIEKEGSPHFVSEVSKYAPCHRVAISGWYNES